VNAESFVLELISDAERLLRRVPASRSRLPGELHELVIGPRDPLMCPHCRTRYKGPRPPPNVMVECQGCADGLLIA